MLMPTGVLRLAVPDKRYCFDYRRRLSSIADVVAAHLEKRTRPSIRATYEQEMYVGFSAGVINVPSVHWGGNSPRASDFAWDIESHKRGLRMAELQANGPNYVDVHCWQFTPESFVAIIDFLHSARLVPLRVQSVVPTPRNSHTFLVDLSHAPLAR